MRRPPPFETRHRRFHQPLCDSAVPEIGRDRQRAKISEAAPVACETRTGQLSTNLGGKRCLRISSPARLDICRIAQEIDRIGQAKERIKSEAHDAIGLTEVSFA